MNYPDIKTGTRLEITWFRPGGTEGEITSQAYISQLLEPARGNELIIAVPIQEFRLIEWIDGCHLRVTFTQTNTCVWSFTASLAGRVEVDRIQAFIIRAEGPLNRQQRREWYRLPATLDMTFRLLPPDASDPAACASAEQVYQAITRDISGGGTAFIADSTPLEPETEVEVSLNLDNRRPVIARGRIIRIGEPDRKTGRRPISLQFTEISQPNQDTLVQYIFQQQLKQRRV